jgi:ABC-type multidrug transport system ATPase subunit
VSGGAQKAAPPALEVRGVSKLYHKTVTALDDVSLTVDGEIFGLLGANGAGKSTLLKSILGIVEPDNGEILVGGHKAGRLAADAKKLIGYLPENLRLYERLTGWEFLEFIAGIKGVSDMSGVEADLERLGMADRRHVLAGEYSLGMRKKLGIAAAMMGDPPLLLLDEPLNGLDTESMRLLRLRIEELRGRGSTIVISSHVMSFVERICGRMAILRNGRIAVEGTADDLRREAAMPDQAFEDVFLHFAVDRLKRG